MALQSRALQSCFDEVADSAPMALERCLNHVVEVLQDAEVKSVVPTEKTELGNAWRELLKHQAAWCRRYPDELRAIFSAAGLETHEKAAAPPRDTFEAGLELTLLDDAALEEEIASSRLVQHLLPMVERPVSELDALVSTAMGLPSVRPELNPVRPEVFAQSLRSLIERTQLNAPTRSLWMKYMAEPLGQELQQLYGRLVVQLKDANVQAAEYRLAQSAGPATGRQFSDSLLRDFLADGAREQASQALPPSYYVEVERELVRLKAESQVVRDIAPAPAIPESYRELPPVDRPLRMVGVQSTLNSQVWGDYANSHERSLVRTQLRKDATRVAQVLGLELVRKVVNQIAQDPRLLAPVREAIVALEPSLLRLAMVDPRFFSEEQHPGRRLMERTAQRSFKYNDEFDPEFAAFFDGMSRCFNELNQGTIEDAKPFEAALASLEASWSAQDTLEADPRMQALRAMQFAEKRQAEADRISWELGTRSDLEAVPAVVRDFLFGPWALVLAHARLVNGGKQIDPQGYLAVVSDLLWSVKPEVTLREPAHLFERLPPLLGTLRAGLASLGHETDAHEPFFEELMTLHRPVLKLRRAKSRRDARESGIAPLPADEPMPAAVVIAEAQNEEEEPPIDSQPWMSARELNALGFQETMPTDMAALWAEEEAASASAPLQEPQKAAEPVAQAAEPVDPQAIVANLREGDWIDLYSKRRWRRAQLIWASTRGTLFMFVSHGGEPHSMTKRICERLIRERYLRPVRMHGVVAQALHTLDREDVVNPAS
ncbi:MAG: hypothetical protein K0Q43_5721 [Ramlibacter sp.]|jgi:hypothetical protein|nr:hypothetical protein [Ramlibacter sp.]